MWALEIELCYILLISARSRSTIESAIVEEAKVLCPGSCNRAGHMPRVLQAVHATNFIAIVGRNWRFNNPQSRSDELDDDLCVEMEIIGVQIEGNVFQRSNRINSVTGMKLCEGGTEHLVFVPAQNFVANKLVKRHAPPERRAF